MFMCGMGCTYAYAREPASVKCVKSAYFSDSPGSRHHGRFAYSSTRSLEKTDTQCKDSKITHRTEPGHLDT